MGKISYRIDREKNVVYEKVTGRLTAAEMIEHANSMVLEPAHRSGMNFITDISEAEIDPSFEMLIELQNSGGSRKLDRKFYFLSEALPG